MKLKVTLLLDAPVFGAVILAGLTKIVNGERLTTATKEAVFEMMERQVVTGLTVEALPVDKKPPAP